VVPFCALFSRDACLGANLPVVDQNAEAQKRVEADIEKTEEAVAEMLSRLARLRKQRKLLQGKTSELLARGLRDLDEEDGVRSQEEAILAEQQAVGGLHSLGALDIIDWTAMPGFFDPPVGSSDGIGGEVSERSSGV
jgi:hypothetical protein